MFCTLNGSFIIPFIGHLGNTDLLSYTDLLNIDIFHYYNNTSKSECKYLRHDIQLPCSLVLSPKWGQNCSSNSRRLIGTESNDVFVLCVRVVISLAEWVKMVG